MFELKLMVQIMCWYPVHLAMGRCRVHAAKLRNRSKPREPEEKAVAVAAMDRSFWEAIAISLQAMASRLEAITTTTLQAIPRRLEAIATTTLQAIPSRLEAIASRVCVCVTVHLIPFQGHRLTMYTYIPTCTCIQVYMYIYYVN